ncbi:integral membrane protein [Lactiplantibacillus plantarum]|nr:integral membrane protein [Lactiplantibacillus plantarum]MCG0919042.1 integral membrane protein [Lactiplantibacillus plantarum]
MKVKITKRQLISGAVLLALLLIGLLIYRYHGTWEIIQHRVFDQSALVAQVRRHRAIDILLVVPLLICFSIIPGAPVATISVVAGICFVKGLGGSVKYYWHYAGQLDCTTLFRTGNGST